MQPIWSESGPSLIAPTSMLVEIGRTRTKSGQTFGPKLDHSQPSSFMSKLNLADSGQTWSTPSQDCLMSVELVPNVLEFAVGSTDLHRFRPRPKFGHASGKSRRHRPGVARVGQFQHKFRKSRWSSFCNAQQPNLARICSLFADVGLCRPGIKQFRPAFGAV